MPFLVNRIDRAVGSLPSIQKFVYSADESA
jgi:hypothetical protein